MGGYVNIKTFDHEVEGGTVKGMEVSVKFELYSDAHRISRAHYKLFPSDKPAYSTVIDSVELWEGANKEMFTPVPAEQ